MCCSLVWCSSTLVLTRMDNNLEKHSSKKDICPEILISCFSALLFVDGEKMGHVIFLSTGCYVVYQKEKLTTLWAFTYIPSPEFCSSSYPGWRRELVYGVSGSEKSYMLVPFLQQYKHNVRSCKSERGELSAGMQTD